jgi:hypothetical protein
MYQCEAIYVIRNRVFHTMVQNISMKRRVQISHSLHTDKVSNDNATSATVLVLPGSTGEEEPAQVERRTGAHRITVHEFGKASVKIHYL